MSSGNTKEPGFRESVNILFDRAVRHMNLSEGLVEKIKVANSTYTVRFRCETEG